jgi:hypothetical protein
LFEIKPNLWSPDGQMTERNGQCIFEDNYEWQNGISPVLLQLDIGWFMSSTNIQN